MCIATNALLASLKTVWGAAGRISLGEWCLQAHVQPLFIQKIILLCGKWPAVRLTSSWPTSELESSAWRCHKRLTEDYEKSRSLDAWEVLRFSTRPVVVAGINGTKSMLETRISPLYLCLPCSLTQPSVNVYLVVTGVLIIIVYVILHSTTFSSL